jgi:hypothetical protein
MTLIDLQVGTNELLADWIETSLFVSKSGHVTVDRLTAIADEELNLPQERVAQALEVIRRRSLALGDWYPLQVDIGLALQRRSSSLTQSYRTLVFLTPNSIARQLLGPSIATMSEILEAIAVRALANYWGPGGDAVSFAYPSAIGRPPEFDHAILWLAKRMGLGAGQGYRPPRRKDGGVDVVAWRRFGDMRLGFPIALAQCTIQLEAFTKTTDIDLRLWATWLALDSDPTSLLVLPGTIRRAGPEWGQLTSVVTVIERLRLVELLGRAHTPDTPNAWTVDVAERLATRMVAGEL